MVRKAIVAQVWGQSFLAAAGLPAGSGQGMAVCYTAASAFRRVWRWMKVSISVVDKTATNYMTDQICYPRVGETAESGSDMPPVCSWKKSRYGLVSLLEIMKPFRANFFLAHIRMLESFLRTAPGQMDEELRLTLQSVFEDTERDCVELGLIASRISVKRAAKLLSKPDCTFAEFQGLVKELQDRTIDEMSTPRFFWVTDSEADHYNRWLDGWQEILQRFPAAVTDVAEMRK